MGIFPPTLFRWKISDPSEVGDETDGALGVFIGGESGEVRVGDVAEFFDGCEDFGFRLFGNAEVIFQSSGDGGVVDSNFPGDVAEGNPFQKESFFRGYRQLMGFTLLQSGKLLCTLVPLHTSA